MKKRANSTAAARAETPHGLIFPPCSRCGSGGLRVAPIGDARVNQAFARMLAAADGPIIVVCDACNSSEVLLPADS